MGAPTVIRDTIKLHRAQLAGIVEKRGVGRLATIYETARAELQGKLDALMRGQAGTTFQAQHYRLMLVQLHEGLRAFGEKFREHLTDTGTLAATLGNRHLIAEIKKFERAFSGTTPVLQAEQIGVYRRIWQGIEPSLLTRYQTSVQLYGRPTIEAIHEQMAVSLASGETVDQATERVAGTSGAFAGQKWRAERIVRTEGGFSYNASKLRTMEEIHGRDMPDLQKRLVSTFDDRTGRDSYEQHLQTVPVNGEFVFHHVDGKGHRTGEVTRYAAPPNRPHDRSTMISWRPGWQTPASLAAPPAPPA